MHFFIFNSRSFSVAETGIQPMVFEQHHEIRKAHVLKPEEEIKDCTSMV